MQNYTLTITGRGQITLRSDVLRHLGIQPGEKIQVEKVSDGRIMLRAAQRGGTIDDFIGMLAGKRKKIATIEEMNLVSRIC